MTYVSGFLTPVPDGNRDAYVTAADNAWVLFKEYGATEMMEGWGDNIPEGKTTDFRRAVDLRDGETVVFSWVLWPDKATSDKCEAAMQSDERFQALDMPFDGKRMIFGGFTAVVEHGR